MLALSSIPSVVVLQVSILLSGGARESRDNVSGLPNGLSKGIMGWGSTNLDSRACIRSLFAGPVKVR